MMYFLGVNNGNYTNKRRFMNDHIIISSNMKNNIINVIEIKPLFIFARQVSHHII